MAHPGTTVGFRLEWPGHSLAYVTDTTADPSAEYVERLRGVDLLFHECNFDDSLREHAILTGHSPTTPVAEVARAEPVYEPQPGWTEALSGVRRFEDLPAAARRYVDRIESLAGVPIEILSVGPGRDETIVRSDPFRS